MKAMMLADSKAERHTPLLQIRDPYTFEFLGLQAKDVVTESDIEEALLGHLQEFLLELGKGFCFEARQKRIIIDGEYYFADLVFYNRLLHCNVIVELKNDEFRHEHIGQLNAYVSYYAENEMQPGDNPPVGILLCTHKGKKMVEYALGSMDNHLFVSTYQLQLPNRQQLEQFLMDECREQSSEV
ncbi:PDDEXK nuclease domain-containing protein, partial [Bacteroides salyersiae]